MKATESRATFTKALITDPNRTAHITQVIAQTTHSKAHSYLSLPLQVTDHPIFSPHLHPPAIYTLHILSHSQSTLAPGAQMQSKRCKNRGIPPIQAIHNHQIKIPTRLPVIRFPVILPGNRTNNDKQHGGGKKEKRIEKRKGKMSCKEVCRANGRIWYGTRQDKT